MKLGLDGRVALVTGGSEGLGRAIATGLVAEGARVAIVARRAEVLEATAADIRARTPGADVLAIAADVSDPDAPAHVVDSVVDRFGQLDILVNNAGTASGKPFLEIDDAAWHADLDLKLLGAVRLIRLAVPHMRRQGGGRVVNVLAMGAKAPGAASAPSTVSRAAGMALTKALSKEFAPEQILVNAVLIGLVKSGQWERVVAASGGTTTLDDLYAGMASSVPVGRIADAEELADLVVFLVSDRARYITGCAINFDGGASPVV
jgi:NAD(P)-dependent dehydrogenase (short-subunit alcohol dehydrogenase family)